MKYLTPQQIFNRAGNHLLKQQCRAYDSRTDMCAYLTKNGMKCAVGALIPASVYDPNIESMGVDDLGTEFLKRCKLDATDDKTMSLLDNLQCIHDNKLPENWHYHLKELAEKKKLSTKWLKV